MKIGDVVVMKQGSRDDTIDWDISGYRMKVVGIFGPDNLLKLLPVEPPEDYVLACQVEHGKLVELGFFDDEVEPLAAPDFIFNCPDCGDVPSQPWRQIAAANFIAKCPRCKQMYVVHVEFYKVFDSVVQLDGAVIPDDIQILIEKGLVS